MHSTSIIKNALLLVLVLQLFACTKDLDRKPTNALSLDQAYKDMDGYRQAVAKVYGSYGLTGNAGNGSSELQGIDPGASDFLRLFWNMQELPTDEAVCAWGDPGLIDLHDLNWSSGSTVLMGLYSRCLFHISVCNQFIRESAAEKLAARGITAEDAKMVGFFRAEARFLRAFQYWVLMEMYGNPPFVTDSMPIGSSFLPPQIKRADLFNYIERELDAIEPMMVKARQNEYGRADEAAVWALKARMFLNAATYLGDGHDRYNDALKNANKVINAGYSLMPDYQHLFLADNNKNNPEVILSINYDVQSTVNSGGTTFIINGGLGSPVSGPDVGMNGSGWAGNRATKNLPLLFGDYVNTNDQRAIFHPTEDMEMINPREFKQGVQVMKFKNLTRDGVIPPAEADNFSSVDFPLFRLAEMYLIYAEAVKRGAADGNEAKALGYLNLLRERAYGNNSGNINSYDLDFILDERGRELYWEAFRRTDMIRFGVFTSNNYLWPWKGGEIQGRGVDAYRKLFPIPSSDLISNPGLDQNEGY